MPLHKRQLRIAGLVLLIAVPIASWLYETFRPRTGREIYASVFGKPGSDCVEVLHHQDQAVPLLDYGIHLHFTSCPAETGRLLRSSDYDTRKKAAFSISTSGPSWFRPGNMGDSVLVCTCFKGDGKTLTLYCNADSTELYCENIMD